MAESNLKDHNCTIVWATRPWTVSCRYTHDCGTSDVTQMNKLAYESSNTPDLYCYL